MKHALVGPLIDDGMDGFPVIVLEAVVELPHEFVPVTTIFTEVSELLYETLTALVPGPERKVEPEGTAK